MITDHDKKYTHPDDFELLEECKLLAERLSLKFGFRFKCLEHKRRPLADGAQGLCYPSEGRISVVIRCRKYADQGGGWWSSRNRKEYIFDTVIHEVAHLPHQLVKGKKGYLPDNASHRQLQAVLRYFAREEKWI